MSFLFLRRKKDDFLDGDDDKMEFLDTEEQLQIVERFKEENEKTSLFYRRSIEYSGWTVVTMKLFCCILQIITQRSIPFYNSIEENDNNNNNNNSGNMHSASFQIIVMFLEIYSIIGLMSCILFSQKITSSLSSARRKHSSLISPPSPRNRPDISSLMSSSSPHHHHYDDNQLLFYSIFNYLPSIIRQSSCFKCSAHSLRNYIFLGSTIPLCIVSIIYGVVAAIWFFGIILLYLIVIMYVDKSLRGSDAEIEKLSQLVYQFKKV